MGEQPTHVALYDIVDQKCMAEFNTEPYGLNIIFSIFPALTAEGLP